MEQVRFGARLRVEERVDAGCGRCTIPPLLVQPLVENAIKHGVAGLLEGGTIRLGATCEDGLLRLQVENEFDAEVPPPRKSGLGLVNVRNRLSARYEHRARLSTEVKGNCFLAELIYRARNIRMLEADDLDQISRYRIVRKLGAGGHGGRVSGAGYGSGTRGSAEGPDAGTGFRARPAEQVCPGGQAGVLAEPSERGLHLRNRGSLGGVVHRDGVCGGRTAEQSDRARLPTGEGAGSNRSGNRGRSGRGAYQGHCASRHQVRQPDDQRSRTCQSAGLRLGQDCEEKARRNDQTQLITSTGLVLGTVQYMSPEQALGKELDYRTDIFSLGVVLYECATARLPFAGSNTQETVAKLLQSQPEAVARFNYEVPAELDRVIRKCLEKDGTGGISRRGIC